MLKNAKTSGELNDYINLVLGAIRNFELTLKVRAVCYRGSNERGEDPVFRIPRGPEKTETVLQIPDIVKIFHVLHFEMPDMKNRAFNRDFLRPEDENIIRETLKKLIEIAHDLDLEIMRSEIPKGINEWVFHQSARIE